MNNNSNIISLKGSNYATWKVQCQMALMKDNLWGIVDGSEVQPAQADAGQKYMIKRNRALAIIVLAVDPTLLYLLGEPDNPKTVWDKLRDQFQKKSWANKLALRRRLYAMRLGEVESMDKHIKLMTEVFNELAVIGDPLKEEDRVIQLLASLPESYSMLVTALEALPDVPEMETVVERLRHEERKVNDRSSEGGQEKALTSRRKGPMCYNCQNYGHIKKNCPQLKADSSKPTPKKQGKAKACTCNARLDEGSDDDVAFIAQHALSTSTKAGGWIVDSGATAHMCNDRKLFKGFTCSSEPVSVTLGDGHALESTGVGDVKLEMKMSNGKTQTCTLVNVLCVPGLAYNLLSVSKASEAGMTAVFSNTECQIKTAGHKVVAVASSTGSLYYLDCT